MLAVWSNRHRAPALEIKRPARVFPGPRRDLEATMRETSSPPVDRLPEIVVTANVRWGIWDILCRVAPNPEG